MNAPRRDALRRYCERYAYQTRHGTEAGGDLVLDDLVVYVEAVGAGCLHPGTCEPSNRSTHCNCRCSSCVPA